MVLSVSPRRKQTDRITLRSRSLAAVEGSISENSLSSLINHVLPLPMLLGKSNAWVSVSVGI